MLDLNKALELKKKMEEIQARLESIQVTGNAGEGKFSVEVTASASRKIRNIAISEALLTQGDKDYLEDLVTIAVNRALENAQGVAEAEARAAALGGGFPGLM